MKRLLAMHGVIALLFLSGCAGIASATGGASTPNGSPPDAAAAANTAYTLVAWSELGMHLSLIHI